MKTSEFTAAGLRSWVWFTWVVLVASLGAAMLVVLRPAHAQQVAPAEAAEPVVVQSVSAQATGGSEVVRIELSRPLAALPSSFSIQSPARVALDIPGARSGLDRNTVELNQGNLRSVHLVEAADRIREAMSGRFCSLRTLVSGCSFSSRRIRAMSPSVVRRAGSGSCSSVSGVNTAHSESTGSSPWSR